MQLTTAFLPDANFFISAGCNGPTSVFIDRDIAHKVRMLEGRVDVQGTIKDLRAQGVLEEIIALEKEEANKLNRSTMRCSYTNGNEDSPNNAKRP